MHKKKFKTKRKKYEKKEKGEIEETKSKTQKKQPPALGIYVQENLIVKDKFGER